MDLLGLIIGAVLTLLIFSYLLGDNMLYRWALALLVGAAAGYTTAVAVRFVYYEWIARALLEQDATMHPAYVVPLLLGCLLLLKGFTSTRFLGRVATIGNIPLGYLVGAGAAVAVSGALMGTLIPVVLSTGQGLQIEGGLLGMIQGGIVIVSTIITLLAFSAHLKKRESSGDELSSWRLSIQRLGGALLAIALGAAFTGAVTSALTAMVIRLWQMADLLDRLTNLVGG